VLLDVWPRKIAGGRSYDITWTGFVGKSPSVHGEIFKVVRQARDIGVKMWSKA